MADTDASNREAGRPDDIRSCPACDGPLTTRKCKRVCARCGILVENCSGD